MAHALVPTLELAGPGGDRIRVAPRSPDDRVGELADAIGLAPSADLEIDGRPVTRYETIGRAGVVRGSRLTVARRGAAVATADPVVVAVCEAGPGAGPTVGLAPGRHVVGRTRDAAVFVDDRRVEAHHALLDVSPDGAVTFRQLTGRVPCRVDGEPAGGWTAVADGGVVTLGASRVRLARPEAVAATPATVAPGGDDPWRRVLRRVPRAVPQWAPAPVPVPDLAAAAPVAAGGTGLVAAALGAAGAVVVAVVMGSAVFLVLAAVGLLASVGMWVAGGLGASRARRRRAVGHERELAAFRHALDEQRAGRAAHHAATTPGVPAAVAAARALRQDVWCRRAGHADVHRATIGHGPVGWDAVTDGAANGPLPPEVATVVAAAGTLDDVAVPVHLGADAALAITGTDARAVARSVIVQLAVWTGPADLALVVIAADPAAWAWCRWLPHTAGPDGPRVVGADDGDRVAAALATLDDGSRRHVVVVTDRPDALTLRTGPVRRFLGTSPSAAVIAVVGPDGTPPALCRSVLDVGSTGRGRWCADASVDGHPVPVHVAGITAATALDVARALAGLIDPEAPPTAGAAALGVTIGALSERHGPAPIDDPIAVAAGWRGAGVDPPPIATLGAAADGVVAVDLARDGPHVLVAGTTGSGKSELLRTLVVSLAARCSPDHVTFVLVDYKGGSTFDACADLPHTVGVVTDLDDELAVRALSSLEAEVRRREHLLRRSGSVDLAEHRARCADPLPRLVVVVDEFATLAAELPDFLGALVGVAQRGRSLGIHLVLATQRPGGVVSDDIRANTNLRIALRLHDVADARDVVGHDAPTSFPRGAPGRALLRLGADEHVLFQAARSSAPAEPVPDDRLHVVADAPPGGGGGGEAELAVLVRTIRNAAALSDVAAPHRPWLPPLPGHLGRAELIAQGGGDAAIGLVDDPAGQCRRALRWAPDDGNLAVVGARGSGTTTALRAVVVAAAHGVPPADRHLYVVDATGDRALDALTGLAHCGGVVRPHERERLSRLLRRLAATLDARRAAPDRGDQPDVVLAVDGMPALRAALDDPHDHRDLDLLGRLVAEGPAVGIVTVMTAERPAALPASLLATCGTRWIGQLDDPTEATVCGVPAALVTRRPPGRFVDAGSRLAAQIVADVGPLASGGGGPAPLAVLPALVGAAPGGARAAGDVRLDVGVDFATLARADLAVPDGEHVLVAGPPRSGRTTALATLLASWRAVHPDGRAWVVAPGRSGAWAPDDVVGLDAALGALGSIAGCGPGAAPTLLVVDDAERVDDPRLAPLVASRRPGLLVVAAGRPDALRPLYGHWTTVVRRSRLGVLLAGCTDVDGDLLGELLPRRAPIPARPGLAWLVDGAGRRLAQVSR